jgi:hypothetical protein
MISNLQTQIKEKDAIVLGTKNEAHLSKRCQEKIKKAMREITSQTKGQHDFPISYSISILSDTECTG